MKLAILEKPYPHLQIIQDKENGYIGFAPAWAKKSDPYWMICKETDSDTEYTMQFADKSTEMEKVWDNRATYTYDPNPAE